MTVFRSFGDSISAAFGVSPTNELYLARAAGYFGYSLANYAVATNMAADQSWLAYGISPVASETYTVCLGVNDASQYGDSAFKRENGFIPFLRGLVAWLALPSKVIARTGMTKSAGWTNTPANSIGSTAAAIGETASCSVSGEAVYVFGIIQNAAASEGRAEVKVDGASVGFIEPRGTSIGDTILGRSFSLACWRFSGLTPGTHTVQIVTTSANSFFLDAVAGSDQAAKPVVIVGDISRRQPPGYSAGNSDANIASYCGSIAVMIGELARDGLNVKPLIVNAAIDAAADLFPDRIHWNAGGHQKVYLNLLNALAPP